MSRIVFESERPIAQVDPVRADVACFVGLVRFLPTASISPAVMQWLQAQGWIRTAPQNGVSTVDSPYARVTVQSDWTPGAAGQPTSAIADVPIPIENYTAFTALFDPGGTAASFGTDYLAAAVRTFFAQGGKRCYIVRMDDPVTPSDTPNLRGNKLQSLLPSTDYDIDNQRGWHGAGHLSGLPEVSFLAMPDLPVLCASQPSGAKGVEPKLPGGPAQFEECSPPAPTITSPLQYPAAAPRFTPDDYVAWAGTVQQVLRYLSQGSLREMLLVASLPMPQETDVAASQENPSESLVQDLHDVINKVMPEPGDGWTGLEIGISTAFLQLGYPWIKTSGSDVLLEDLEPPDGALVGILARNALTRGTFTSAVKVQPAEIYDVSTVLPAEEVTVPDVPLVWGDNSVKPLIERISLFGPTPSGLALLSDVTTYAGESYRPGRIHRLVAVILRAARTLGDRIVFESNGPQLWARVRSALHQLMLRLWQLNALDGETVQDAFSVRCDSSTMTQNDLDNGRLVAIISFNAASTIELIHVTMALETSGTTSQASLVLAEAV